MFNSLSRYKRKLAEIKKWEAKMALLKEADFLSKTAIFKMRLKSGEKKEKLLPEVFALAKEAVKRSTGMEVYDVQLIGALAAAEGNIVEMKTGEGKTLAILFPAFLEALTEKGVHVITANDYLAKRDAEMMGKIYRYLGISANYVISTTNHFDRQVAYAGDVTYSTGAEICFDFLRDNMVYNVADRRHRQKFNFAIIDEADSVLIDEAQIPLIISQRKGSEEETRKDRELFIKINRLVEILRKDVDFKINQRKQTIFLTVEGIKKLEKILGVENLYADEGENYVYYLERLLKAHHFFQKDKDYIVDNDEAVIVDEFTGRLMFGHRFFQGIHQAIEAKENLPIKEEDETLASITYQHFFRHYENFCGFTGTAKTAEKELKMIYGKKVFITPTNRPIVREDTADKFFLTWEDKLRYLVWEIEEHYLKERPVLVGTRSVIKSQQVQRILATENIPSNVLNAKNTAREAEVVAQAGKAKTVTVATNIAGRGTDIVLDSVSRALGGMVVFGLERHNARRIDNQLIGRAGRQGDPGRSSFLISADDELIKNYFLKEYQKAILKENYQNGVESRRLEKILEKAQKRMEEVFFDQRVLGFEFDKVLEKQRESFYRQRRRVLEDNSLREETLNLLILEVNKNVLGNFSLKKLLNEKEAQEIKNKAQNFIGNRWFHFSFPFVRKFSLPSIKALLQQAVEKYYKDFENFYSPEKTRQLEKAVTLKVLDLMWKEHLKKVEEFQTDALIESLGQEDFFNRYEQKIFRLYQNFLLTAPEIIIKTFLKTMNRLWEEK